MNRSHPSPQAPQRGIALVTVLVIVGLGVVGILGAFRLAGLAETATGSYADYSRTFAAAEATLRDAENDIRGRLPNPATPGNVWSPHSDGGIGVPCKDTAPPMGQQFVGCRTVDAIAGNTNNFLWVPLNSQDYAANYLIAMNTAGATRCRQGICVPDSMANLVNLHQAPQLQQVFAEGAHYGEFTGATPGASEGNPSLTQNTPATTVPGDGMPWSRYWIEVFRYGQGVNNGASAAADLVPDPSAPFVYRITAIAQGRKAGSRVVLREIFVPNPIAQNP
jgi:type IV pilus assembly protein PilX